MAAPNTQNKQREQERKSAFISDIKTIRERARQQIEKGAVTPSYGSGAEALCELLNEALATEIVCVLRYKRHYYMAEGVHSEGVKAEFLEHANDEQEHADRIAERIVQLGGEPNFSPEGLASRAHAQYEEGKTLRDMIREDLIAERIAIESYREMIAFVKESDPTTRKMLEEILASEEEHADDMATLYKRVAE